MLTWVYLRGPQGGYPQVVKQPIDKLGFFNPVLHCASLIMIYHDERWALNDQRKGLNLTRVTSVLGREGAGIIVTTLWLGGMRLS